jgi:hypothetical protein
MDTLALSMRSVNDTQYGGRRYYPPLPKTDLEAVIAGTRRLHGILR